MLWIDFVIVLLAILTLCIVVTGLLHVRTRVPFIPTPHLVARRMAELADVRPGERVLDLGAGDARILLAAEQRHPGIVAEGYELQPFPWIIGRIRIALRRSRVRLLWRDARTADMHTADCIFLYLTPNLMQEFASLFDARLRPGSRVITYTFAFRDRIPVHEEDVPWMGATRRLRVYHW